MLHRTRLAFLACIAWSAASPAAAQLCDGSTGRIASDGRVLGHLPYGDVAEGDLIEAPAGFAIGQRCMVRREVFADLRRLIGAAEAAAGAPGVLRGLSCHRSIARQSTVFCRERPEGGAGDRAISVAPPGHSEHSTGYAVDFAIRPSPNCPDAEACMAATPGFRWLIANAPRFGFEMSFPTSNRQNVKWEPWHWRWVGETAAAPGATRARFVFARPRRDFPANPGVYPPAIIVVAQQPPAIALPVPAPAKAGKRRRR